MATYRPALSGEAGAMAEYAALAMDPVFLGVGVPRGDGRPVLVLPGLFGNDLYLAPLREWLRRIGYRPVRSALALNAGCPERLSRDVQANLAREAGEGPLSIVGHSRGGILGWALAARMGDRVKDLVLLGSPAGALADAVRHGFGAGQLQAGVSQVVIDAGARARRRLDPDCGFPACGCPFAMALSLPLSAATNVTSIASLDDAIVPHAACQVPRASNLDVRGTHSGLAVNRHVYRLLGPALAHKPS
jgi:pimeloyl-ACP methyl ester carboxylesterase